MQEQQYNLITQSPQSTVVAQYVSPTDRPSTYQSEAQLEQEFIRQLQAQGYEYAPVTTTTELEQNLRRQLEKLNDYCFSDPEWQRFYLQCISKPNESIVEKTQRIQTDPIQVLTRDDGSSKNIRLIDKLNIHRNSLQVIHQFQQDQGKYQNRYDVTILVNGLPLVHVELKRRGVALKEAFNQIKRYQNESFWAAGGLFEYVQIFVISNGTHTKYYSNTTRESHLHEQGKQKGAGRKTSNSFEFTSYWADASNKVIMDLVDFTRTFMARHTVLNVLTKYCVWTTENKLMVMRPYQIAATEAILNRIELAHNYKWYGKVQAGGYVWHTTGSGKTLTSFKTSQLASSLPYIDKVLFVVDRKDLDYQTMKEYDRFEKGAANSNTSTRVLTKQLEDPSSRIIITTIQKLDNFIRQNKSHEVYSRPVVLIFDECHRSQFGSMHQAITKAFSKYYIFGFTGTPIFSQNTSSGALPTLKTTEQAFGMKLHTYTIVNAISDENVLPFRIDYINTAKSKSDASDKQVRAIDTRRALLAPERICQVVSYILEHFDQKTKRNEHYEHKGKVLRGFNSIFAVDSIPAARLYYKELKQQIPKTYPGLKVATIFTYAPNEDPQSQQGLLDLDEDFDTANLDQSSREFLDDAILDYNLMFSTSFDTSPDRFQNYYKDISARVKNREIDLLLVVNMFLTGFDATTLNTLWVDKNLRMHGLMQAFSRTNRILNSVKTFGNIVCFRDLQLETDEAIALFGDKDAKSIVMLKPYDAYLNGYEEKDKRQAGYLELARELEENYPLGEPLVEEEKKQSFVQLFGRLLKLRNILSCFDEFSQDDCLSERKLQDYTSTYLDLWHEMRPKHKEKEVINDDLIFEIELVRQVEVNIAYILALVEKYRRNNCEDKEFNATVARAINSSIRLRSKKELIENFIQTVNATTDVYREWNSYVEEQKQSELERIIEEERLKPDQTRSFVEACLQDGELKTTGTKITELMPPTSRFAKQENHDHRKQNVIGKLMNFFEKFLDLG